MRNGCRVLLMIVLSVLQWVTDGSPSHSTPIKIEAPNQFVPLNTNPKEFKKVQKMVSAGKYNFFRLGFLARTASFENHGGYTLS
jgi:hypothetical protein